MLKNNTTKTVGRLFLGILIIIATAILIMLLFTEVIDVKDLSVMKWLPILICSIGFYLAGLINRRTKIVLTLFLFTSWIIFVPLEMLHFPFFIIVAFVSILSILLTRKEVSSKFKFPSFALLILIFGVYLFSQPFIIKHERFGTNGNNDLFNATVLWDFSTKGSSPLSNEIFRDNYGKEIKLEDFHDKTVYVTFWATWCGPCIQQKPYLEKLKQKFQENSDIVFIDISIDSDVEKWKNYLSKNEQEGIQLISLSIAKTRFNYQFSGIPYHILVDLKSNYKEILGPYSLINDSDFLANSDRLEEFMNTPYKVFKIFEKDGRDTTIRVR